MRLTNPSEPYGRTPADRAIPTPSEALSAPTAATRHAYDASRADALLAAVADAARRRRQHRCTFAPTAAVWGFLLWIFHVSDGRIPAGFCIPMFSAFIAVGLIRAAARRKQYWRAVANLAAAEFAGDDAVRAIGSLAKSLDLTEPSSRELRRVVTDALIRLLPRLTTNDSSMLSAEQRACLTRALEGTDEELAIAILHAFDQVGDSSSIPTVEWLAAGDGLASGDARVHEAAQACLAFLRYRAARVAASQTLLRPADEPGRFTDTLLRPAAEPRTDAPEQLLRPQSGREGRT